MSKWEGRRKRGNQENFKGKQVEGSVKQEEGRKKAGGRGGQEEKGMQRKGGGEAREDQE